MPPKDKAKKEEPIAIAKKDLKKGEEIKVDLSKNIDLSFWERLSLIQDESPEIKKNGYNKFKDYYYPLIDDILKLYKPLLSSHKLVLVNKLDTEKGLLTTVIRDVLSTEEISTNYKIKIGEDQDMGKSLTYGRRYNAGLLLNIATEEDTDANEVEVEKKAAAKGYAQPNKTITTGNAKKPAANTTAKTPPTTKSTGGGITASVKQIELITKLIPAYEKKPGINPGSLERILKSYNKTYLKSLTIKQASETITKLKKAIG